MKGASQGTTKANGASDFFKPAWDTRQGRSGGINVGDHPDGQIGIQLRLAGYKENFIENGFDGALSSRSRIVRSPTFKKALLCPPHTGIEPTGQYDGTTRCGGRGYSQERYPPMLTILVGITRSLEKVS